MNWLTRKPDPKFIEWCKESYDESKDNIIANQLIKPRHENERENLEKKFSKEIVGRLANKGTFNIFVDIPLQYDKFFFVEERCETFESYLGQFNFRSDGSGCIDLKNLNIKTLNIHDSGNQKDISLSNCNIKTIILNSSKALSAITKITLINSNVGHLVLNSNCLFDLDISNGSILNISCPPPHQNNPFTGSVSFKDVYMPRKSMAHFLSGPQPYRNLRHHLKNLENSLAASTIHSVELATEREKDTGFNRFIGYLYQSVSDYGSSSFRPLIWFVGNFLVSSVLICILGGATTLEVSDLYVGWRSSLLCEDIGGEVLRSVVLSAQSSFNPLSIFGSRNVVIPQNVWVAGLTSVQGIFSAIFIALFIFALRRRFKIGQ